MDQTLSQRAYEHLRGKLLAGEFEPGQRMRYGPLGKEIGISATPVREAVGQLASEGFVQLVPNLGAVVRQLSRQEAIELYEMREALEAHAAGKAALRIDREQLKRLKQYVMQVREICRSSEQSGDGQLSASMEKDVLAADLAFHATIIKATGNQRLMKVVSDSHVLTRIFGAERMTHDAQIAKLVFRYHWRIYQAIKMRDAAGASRWMRRHIRHSLRQTLDVRRLSKPGWWEV